MFNPNMTPEQINHSSQNTLGSHLGIEFTEICADYLKAKMPVDSRTHQPFGLLHGGASAALIETMGSVGSLCHIDPQTHLPVGLEINANHLRSVTSGYVYGTAEPLHLGRRTHVWSVNVVDEADKLVCTGRLTVMIVEQALDKPKQRGDAA